MPTKPKTFRPHHVQTRQHNSPSDQAAVRQARRDLPTYSGRWRRIRAAQLSREPYCRLCNEQGRLTLANEVDHIKGDAAGHGRENLQSLCKPCHSRKTNRDMGHKSDRGKAV